MKQLADSDKKAPGNASAFRDPRPALLYFSILPSRDSPPDYESRLPKKFAPAPIYRQQEESFRETDETPENLENPAQSRLHKGRRDLSSGAGVTLISEVIRHLPKNAQKRLLYDQLILKSAQRFFCSFSIHVEICLTFDISIEVMAHASY